MTRSAFSDPYRTVIQAFNRSGVRYVVVGLSGVNYYAGSAAETFATMDYDIFVQPTRKNVALAVRCLKQLGFSVGTSAGLLKRDQLADVVRRRRTLVATTTEGITVELLLAVSGYLFAELAKDAATFKIWGVPITVGRLAKLLRSKHLAGRPKDRQFLQRYQSLLEEKQGGDDDLPRS